MEVSRRAKNIPPFYVMDILERALEMERAGRKIYHLEVGEPDFDTPKPIVKAAINALERGYTHYTHSLGILELREAIAEFYKEHYGVDVDPGRIIVSSGSSPILFLIFASILNPGDQVVVTDPSYPCYANALEFLGCTVRRIPLSKENGYQVDIERIKTVVKDGKAKAVVLGSPSNPIGVLVGPETFKALGELGLAVVSDEIYHGLVYEGREKSALEVLEDAIVVGGFSKRFAMTGWRLGYAILPEDLVGAVQRVQQNLIISANSFVQWGGIAALKEAVEHAEKMREVFNRRRLLALSILKEGEIDVGYNPVGAFYIYLDLPEVIEDSYSFSLKLLEKKGVAVTPGIDFGPSGKTAIRISYANSEEHIEKGLKLLLEYIQEVKGVRSKAKTA